MILVSNVMFFGVKESEYDVQIAIIVVAVWYFWHGEVKLTGKFNFRVYFLLSNHICQSTNYIYGLIWDYDS